MRTSGRLKKCEEEGTAKNTSQQKRKQVEVMDSSSHSEYGSPLNVYQSDSWECPPSTKKHSIPDAMMDSSRRASLRSAKRLTEKPSVSRCSQPQKSREHAYAIDVFQQAWQAPAGSLVSPSRYHIQAANPSTLTQQRRNEETETVENTIFPGRFISDMQEMEGVHEAEKSMPNHSNQKEGPNTFEAEYLPPEQPSAMDLQASNNVGERVNKDHSKPISMVGRPSPSLSLKLTEMVNMWGDEDDEVNSVRQRSTMDTEHGYQVKPESMPMLRKILSKHGDIAKNCTVLRMKYRSMLLEMIFDIITELQDKDISGIKEDYLLDMIGLVNEMKNMNVDVGWLQGRLEEILEARQILQQSGMLKEKRESNRETIENVEKELEECEAEKMAIAARHRAICDKEAACKETLAKARDDRTRIKETITYAKAKVRRFHNCSLADDLL